MDVETGRHHTGTEPVKNRKDIIVILEELGKRNLRLFIFYNAAITKI